MSSGFDKELPKSSDLLIDLVLDVTDLLLEALLRLSADFVRAFDAMLAALAGVERLLLPGVAKASFLFFCFLSIMTKPSFLKTDKFHFMKV